MIAGSIPTHHWLRQRKCRKELRLTTCLSNWSDYFKRPAAVYEWKKSSDWICAVDVNDEYLPSWCLLHLFNKILFLRWFCSVCSEMGDGELNIQWAMTETWLATLINAKLWLFIPRCYICAATAFLDQLFFRRDGETASLWKAQYYFFKSWYQLLKK
jgi:hypothetical protein